MFIQITDRSHQINHVNYNSIVSIRSINNNTKEKAEINLVNGTIIYSFETAEEILTKVNALIPVKKK